MPSISPWRAGPARGVDHIPRDLHIDRAAISQERGEGSVHVPFCRDGIVETDGRDGHAFEHLSMGRETTNHVVEVRIARPLREARRAGQQHHRRAFGIGAGNRIDRIQPPDTISHTEGPDAINAGMGIGRKPGAVLASGPDMFDGRGFDELI